VKQNAETNSKGSLQAGSEAGRRVAASSRSTASEPSAYIIGGTLAELHTRLRTAFD